VSAVDMLVTMMIPDVGFDGYEVLEGNFRHVIGDGLNTVSTCCYVVPHDHQNVMSMCFKFLRLRFREPM